MSEYLSTVVVVAPSDDEPYYEIQVTVDPNEGRTRGQLNRKSVYVRRFDKSVPRALIAGIAAVVLSGAITAGEMVDRYDSFGRRLVDGYDSYDSFGRRVPEELDPALRTSTPLPFPS